MASVAFRGQGIWPDWKLAHHGETNPHNQAFIPRQSPELAEDGQGIRQGAGSRRPLPNARDGWHLYQLTLMRLPFFPMTTASSTSQSTSCRERSSELPGSRACSHAEGLHTVL